MNCLDYRREILAEGRESEPMRLHRVACDACSELHREQSAFEGELRRALEVPVPEGLGERLLRGAWPRRERRRWLAAAAALVAVAGAGALLWRWRDDPMAMACIDFVMKDEAKSIMMGAMPREEAKRMLADTLPLERIERLGQVKHIAPCPFGAGTAYHVILMVPQDKVTLLIMPDTPMASTGRAVQHGMHAAVMPAGKGSVGVVGSSAAVVESVMGAIRA
jgi:hypothetical protein